MKAFTTTYSGFTSLPGAHKKVGELLFGEHRAPEAAKYFKEAKVTRVMAIYDRGVYQAGIVEPVLKAIRSEGIQIVSYDAIPPEPPYTVVDEMAQIANDSDIDGILGIGGGSALDAAKILAIYRHHTDEGSFDLFLKPKNDLSRKKFTKPVTDYMIMIPTTSGTGAEISNGSIIVSSTQAKDAIECPRPDVIILDPWMTATMPPYITATTGLDALAHCIEMYTSAVRNAYSQMYLGEAIEYIWRSLPLAYQNGNDIEARSEMQLAAFLPLQDVCGHCHYGHAVSKTIGPLCHKPHGHLTALALPHVIRSLKNCDELQPDLKKIAKKMNLSTDNDVCETIAVAIEDLTEKLGIKHLEEFQIKFEDMKDGAQKTLETKRNSLANCAAGVPDVSTLENIIRGMCHKEFR